ncbi:MAG: molybdopterin-dependent oxidoreductase, partial [Parahaliea sp.]
GKVVFVNPRKIESSTPETGDVLQIKPDADVYFLAAVLYEIVFVVGFDRDLVERHAKNLDPLLEFIQRYPPSRVETVTGIDADDIRTVAREFCAAPSASIHMSTGVNMGRQGALSYLLVQMISLFSGNLGRRGGNIYQTGFARTAPDSKRKTDQPYFDTPAGEIRYGGSSLPGNLMESIFLQGHSSRTPVRALLVVGGNPLLAVCGEQHLREVFADLELIVCVDLYRNATGEMADYLFPATDSMEREDLYYLGPGLHVEPYVQYTPAVVPPAGERREEWWILSRILQEMGRPSMLDDTDVRPLGAIDARLAESDLSIEKLRAMPCQTAVLPEADPRDIFNLAIQNDDGLIDCFPAVFERGLDAVEAQLAERLREPENQLKLITRRTGLMINSWMHNLSRLKKGVHQSNPLWIHPLDAAERGLHYGDKVRVWSEHGSVEASLAFDEALRPGVVSMSHGWGNQATYGQGVAQTYSGSNVNQLSPVGEGSFDILSSMSHITGFNVNVELIASSGKAGVSSM